MSSLSDACQAIAELANAHLVGVVDLRNGSLLGVYQAKPVFTETYLDALAAAAADMVRGRTVQAVEQLISHHQGQTYENSVQELLVKTPTLNQFISVIPSNTNFAAVMTSDRSTNFAMSWSHLRNGLPRLGELCSDSKSTDAKETSEQAARA